MLTKNEELPPQFIENHSLYYYSTCPFCFRVSIAMKKLGIDMEQRNIHEDSEHMRELKQGGGSTMVPCLRIDEKGQSKWLYESADIVSYLEQQFKTEKN